MESFLVYNYNQKSVVLLFFFLNSLLFAILLFKQGLKENRRDSMWLSFVLLCGLYICPFMLGYAGWYGLGSYREFMFFVPFQQLFLLGPVLYFYTRTLLNRSYTISRIEMWHFLPAAVYLLYSLLVFIIDTLVLDAFYFYADGRDKDLAFWCQMSGLISMLFYLILSLKVYNRYRAYTVEELSYANDVAFTWIKHFLMAFCTILVLRVLFFILNPEWGKFGNKYWFYLCFSILALYIAITGYSSTLRTILNYRFTSPVVLPSFPEPELEKEEEESHSQAGVTTNDWHDKIAALFNEGRVTENPNLTLRDIADELGTNRNVVSGVINSDFGMNFNDYVNKKRTEAVVVKIEQGVHLNHTLLSIALDCGFNSKTTFNRAFKKHTGLTPRQYVEKQKS